LGHSAVSKRVFPLVALVAQRKQEKNTFFILAFFASSSLAPPTPLRETFALFVNSLRKKSGKNPATNSEDAVFTLLEGQNERRVRRKRIVKICRAAVTNQVSGRIIVR